MTVNTKEQINNAIKLHQSGDFEEAEQMYSEILKTEPNNASVLNLLGLLKYQNKQFSVAASYIIKAIEISPCAYFYENLGRIYTDNEDFNEAIFAYKKALQLEPNNFEVLFNLALTLKRNKQPDQAIETYQKALSIKPDYADAYFNIGNIYESKNETTEALNYYQQGVKYNPNDSGMAYFLSTSLLKLKNFEQGWKYFEHRPSKTLSILTHKAQYKNLTNKPLWNGENIKDKTLLIYYEAGLGDTIMFARYLKMLKDKCAKVLFISQIALEPLLKENFPDIEFVDRMKPNIEPFGNLEFDFHAPLMSLPYLLKHTSEDDIPLKDNYLKADMEKVKSQKEKHFNNNKFRIGIKWLGNSTVGLERIIPIEAFYKLFELPNTQFYSLQTEDGIEELEKVKDKYNIIDLGSTFNDFSDTAAAVENLDLIICNDTSLAHLAGAMGKPCWIMLPDQYNWRWHTDLSYSPWYKSVKLFKQAEENNWNGIFTEIYNLLFLKKK